MSNEMMYSSRQLVRVLDDLVVPHTFLLDRYFPDVHNFTDEKIDFDVVTKGKKLAPFVSPVVQGQVRKDRGFTTTTFEPAYVKPKHVLDPTKPFKRRAGERIGGDMTPQARHDAAVAQLLSDERDEILRRLEWMAAQSLVFGKYTVEGENYPKTEVDFGRPVGHSLTLLTTDRWGETGVEPLDDIESWATTVSNECGGVIRDVIFDPLAWQLARKSQKLLDALDNRRQASGNVELGPIQLPRSLTSARYVGSIGDFDFWVYNDTYEDEAGVQQKMIPDYAVILAGPDLEGVRAFGAIRDPKAGYQSVDIYPKMWEMDDPAVVFLMSQSAPLIIPSRPSASFCAIVR